MTGTSTACSTSPMSPVCICVHTAAAERGETLWNTAATMRKVSRPDTCARSTAGNAAHAFLTISPENAPLTAANTASSAIMYGSLSAAGIALPAADVTRKLTTGARSAAPTPQPAPSRQPPSSTGRYMGSHCTPPGAPATAWTICGRATASATVSTVTADLTVNLTPAAAFFLSSIALINISFLLLSRNRSMP